MKIKPRLLINLAHSGEDQLIPIKKMKITESSTAG
jgi:hypothetical protein